MNRSVIDAHIHLDLYDKQDCNQMLEELDFHHIKTLISVSNNLTSAQKNLALARGDRMIKPAFGFHPEQQLPGERELASLFEFIDEHQREMIAIGEVGLPYYLRKENPSIDLRPYIDLLSLFIKLADRFNKPVVLHAIYEDATIVCDLLEEASIKRVHFHWFKGDEQIVERLIRNGYYISITPDVLYEEEIMKLVEAYPLSQMMVETDGPWPFSGRFKNQLTHPKMIHFIVEKIASIKKKDLSSVYNVLFENTTRFYNLDGAAD